MSIIHAQQIVAAMKNLEMQGLSKTAAMGDTNVASEKFSSILMRQLDYVNDAQKTAENLQDKFTLGDPDVSLAQVKTAEMKAAVYTQGLIHVRNEVVKAYNEIMNMPV